MQNLHITNLLQFSHIRITKKLTKLPKNFPEFTERLPRKRTVGSRGGEHFLNGSTNGLIMSTLRSPQVIKSLVIKSLKPFQPDKEEEKNTI